MNLKHQSQQKTNYCPSSSLPACVLNDPFSRVLGISTVQEGSFQLQYCWNGSLKQPCNWRFVFVAVIYGYHLRD